MVGAVYLALSTPLALAYAQPVSAPPAPKPITNPLLVPVPQIKPLEPTALAEVPEVVYVPPTPVYVAPVSGVVANCGDNFYANFIYMHESGCNLNAVNSIGCAGIGQACPASKTGCVVFDSAGNIVNYGSYACQNAWFTQYANSAYGGWAGAYAFWVAHSWW